jgi:hypothetical protein
MQQQITRCFGLPDGRGKMSGGLHVEIVPIPIEGIIRAILGQSLVRLSVTTALM